MPPQPSLLAGQTILTGRPANRSAGRACSWRSLLSPRSRHWLRRAWRWRPVPSRRGRGV